MLSPIVCICMVERWWYILLLMYCWMDELWWVFLICGVYMSCYLLIYLLFFIVYILVTYDKDTNFLLLMMFWYDESCCSVFALMEILYCTWYFDVSTYWCVAHVFSWWLIMTDGYGLHNDVDVFFVSYDIFLCFFY